MKNYRAYTMIGIIVVNIMSAHEAPVNPINQSVQAQDISFLNQSADTSSDDHEKNLEECIKHERVLYEYEYGVELYLNKSLSEAEEKEECFLQVCCCPFLARESSLDE